MNMTNRTVISQLRVLLVSLLLIVTPYAAQAAPAVVRLAVTTSFKDSGLAEKLFPVFTKATGYPVRLYVVGSGAALRMGRQHEVDVTITHSPRDEQVFQADGQASLRRHVMSNDFLIVGPASDPAGLSALGATGDVLAAVRRIAVSHAHFMSRGDDSGTHKLELRLWSEARIDPVGQSWYEELGLGMGATLKAADQSAAYTIVDRGTWLANRQSLTLKALSFGDERLLNRYVAMAVKGSANETGAKVLVNWLGTAQARAVIDGLRVDGQPLFDLPVQK